MKNILKLTCLLALMLSSFTLLHAQQRTRQRTQQRTHQGQQQNQNVVTISVKGVSFKMVRVQGGTFTMGATAEQGGDANGDEKPAHKVTLSNYYIGETEVTQELWAAVMGSNPSEFKGKRHPVERVTWNDCQTFIKKLNQLTGKTFRLPTEAEWEFAARGGTKSRHYKYAGGNTLGSVAWYDENAGDKRPRSRCFPWCSSSCSCWDPSNCRIPLSGRSFPSWCAPRWQLEPRLVALPRVESGQLAWRPLLPPRLAPCLIASPCNVMVFKGKQESYPCHA